MSELPAIVAGLPVLADADAARRDHPGAAVMFGLDVIGPVLIFRGSPLLDEAEDFISRALAEGGSHTGYEALACTFYDWPGHLEHPHLGRVRAASLHVWGRPRT
ncbi:hypothetical protein [Methylorubrum extorquens]|uniref:Uncharacterized protein n=1 Tax=Methylorubrum extorquens (strain CM4 / NCIMB 13688) TaxID=440085 RepID=B7KXS2_METC4|nr:hypothetical protein [Methylorubrum extorquens]ACK84674.1 hypothetical protein Mchl_3862 [Methylorubrum extorquens CM4]